MMLPDAQTPRKTECVHHRQAAGAGYSSKNKRGGASVNPLLGIIRKASRDAVHYATLLGLTSSARATLEVKPQPNDPMDKYFGSKS
jgi:phage terminase small subunit